MRSRLYRSAYWMAQELAIGDRLHSCVYWLVQEQAIVDRLYIHEDTVPRRRYNHSSFDQTALCNWRHTVFLYGIT